MENNPILDYKSICEYVGRLYLETQHQLSILNKQLELQLKRELENAQRASS